MSLTKSKKFSGTLKMGFDFEVSALADGITEEDISNAVNSGNVAWGNIGGGVETTIIISDGEGVEIARGTMEPDSFGDDFECVECAED